jgi:dCMP deaminase
VDDQTAKIFAESGVKLRQFSPPTGGLVDLSVGLGLNQDPGKVEDVRVVINECLL